MIPANFEYYRPTDVNGVIDIICQHGDDARVMAGGHSLIPMMKLRMAEIPHIIDLQDISVLKGITIDGAQVRIGAMTTQAELIDHAGLAQVAPILREAALQIADPQVRSMGTVGGNVANGDPANDMPGLMQCLNAQFTLVGPNGERTVAARDYYEAAYFTARTDEEVLIAISFSANGGGYSYEKQKRKIGDYATAACAVTMLKQGDLCVGASVAMTNLSDVPVWSEAAGEALEGTPINGIALKAAVVAAVNDIDPTEDNRGPVDFKKYVAGVIIKRAIESAWSRA
jgi:carbon-monoxide dehydrogenase medium subunit